MKERHNWASGKHPKTCSCAVCVERRAEALRPKVKKKRKPKSERGKPKKAEPSIFDDVRELLEPPKKKTDDYRKDDLDA